ncbi:MAG: Alpha/Beta hydrolase protein [Benjaminiella poitrasii]|nr:MAG: Alpha/Beta hydrolase protein [Benjaminiella poitrasii]
MNQLRVALNKMPPGATIKILRKVFSLPSPASRLILNDITKPRSKHKSWIHKVPWNDEWSGCWIGENVRKLDKQALLKRIHDSDLVLFNVHGGGFRIGTCTMFMDSWIEWIRVLKENYGLKVMMMSTNYRLSPEHKYPSPVEDVVRAYEHLIKTVGVDPQKIIVTGDSSGASLLLEMLFITHDPSMFEIETDGTAAVLNELPRPAGAVFSSPIVTDETNSDSWKENVRYDYISQRTAKIIKRDYFKPLLPDQPPDTNQILGIAKLETGFKAFLPTRVLMFLGHKEVLRDDALALALKAEQDGVLWETVMEDCVHDWFCVREVVKDKRVLTRANQIFADFCYRAAVRQVHIGYHHYTATSECSSMKRSSEVGLEVVLEEDEEAERLSYVTDDDDEEEDQEQQLEMAKRIIKQNPRTVFV